MADEELDRMARVRGVRDKVAVRRAKSDLEDYNPTANSLIEAMNLNKRPAAVNYNEVVNNRPRGMSESGFLSEGDTARGLVRVGPAMESQLNGDRSVASYQPFVQQQPVAPPTGRLPPAPPGAAPPTAAFPMTDQQTALPPAMRVDLNADANSPTEWWQLTPEEQQNAEVAMRAQNPATAPGQFEDMSPERQQQAYSLMKGFNEQAAQLNAPPPGAAAPQAPYMAPAFPPELWNAMTPEEQGVVGRGTPAPRKNSFRDFSTGDENYGALRDRYERAVRGRY
jgi:hypothetical protein